MGFDFVVIAPILPSHCGVSFVFGCGVSFLVSSSVPVDDCSAVSCDSSALTGGSACTPFFSAILNQSRQNIYADFLFIHTFHYIIFHPFVFKFFHIFCFNPVFCRQSIAGSTFFFFQLKFSSFCLVSSIHLYLL